MRAAGETEEAPKCPWRICSRVILSSIGVVTLANEAPRTNRVLRMAPIASADHSLRGRNCTKLNREISLCATRIPRALPAEANPENVHVDKYSLNTTPFTTSDTVTP